MSPMAAGLIGAIGMLYGYAPNEVMGASQFSSPSALTSHLHPYGQYANSAAAQQQHRPPVSRTEQVRMMPKPTAHANQNATSAHPTGGVVRGPSVGARMEVNISADPDEIRALAGNKLQPAATSGKRKMLPYECIICHRILYGKCALQKHYKIHA
ncbi:hypothetical protein AAVH_35980, partial [Aphelenchoides avenae]